MNFNERKIKELLAAGKIRGFKYAGKPGPRHPKKKGTPTFVKPSKEKQWIHDNLVYWCNQQAVTLETEYKFHPDRKWRFDWAIPSLKIAIEYEGLFSAKSRHTTISGFNNDTEKYNACQAAGWRLLRYTAKNHKNLVQDLQKMVKLE